METAQVSILGEWIRTCHVDTHTEGDRSCELRQPVTHPCKSIKELIYLSLPIMQTNLWLWLRCRKICASVSGLQFKSLKNSPYLI